MKTTKRVLAIALAVLMLALAIPFAASAAEPTTYDLTIKCYKPDYTYSVYKLADFDETTGHFERTQDDAIQTAINQSDESTADVLTAAAATNAQIGDAVDSFTFTATENTHTFNLPAGMYYVKCTGRALNNKEITQDSIVPLPNKTESYTVDVTGKITEKGVPSVHKYLLNSSDEQVTELSVDQNDTIKYKLTADVTGTTENKLSSFIIYDDMDTENLSLADVKITSVSLVSGTTKTPINGYGKVGADTSKFDGVTYDFGISIPQATLNDNAFYAEGNYVEVIFTTKLAATATKIGSPIPNTDGLKYTNKSGNTNEEKGDTVNVYTYKVSVTKVDADDTNIKLKDAKIGIYKTQACTEDDKLDEAITNENGVAAFTHKFAEGTYYVKEIEAPDGYTVNNNVFEVKIVKDGQNITDGIHHGVTITDTKPKLPNTGGAGTLAFTIIGGALVVAAGVLLVIVLKKRSAK